MHTTHHQDPTHVDPSQMSLALTGAPEPAVERVPDRLALLESRTTRIAVEPADDGTGQAVPDEWDLWAADDTGRTFGFWEGWTTAELLQLRDRGHVAVVDRRTRTPWTP
ncbi:hypothetical protein ACFQV2_02305 [Actinokineospora soli]|uniref:Uncharacterized protein n=1 Tax=Actinokineospora soli TaxID=1048753 RepID=A0ABW2TGX2_9PSEU